MSSEAKQELTCCGECYEAPCECYTKNFVLFNAIKAERDSLRSQRDALAEALEKIAGLVGPESEDVMYGSFHGGDPRDFSPDPECSTEAERSAHAVACKKAEEESGAARLLSDTHSFERLDEDAAVHIARAGFGLGTTVFRNEALCEAMNIIDAALLRVKQS